MVRRTARAPRSAPPTSRATAAATAAAAAAPRWHRKPEERPTQILDAALIEFGERGLARTRLDDIARRAGVAKGTIYLYFSTKDELFRAMVRHVTGRGIDAFEEKHAASDAPAAEQLHEYVTGVWAHLRSPAFPILYRLTIGELPEFPDLLRFYVHETAERALKVCSGIIRRGIARGEFRRVDPEAAARMIHAMLIKHGHWCAHREVIPFVAKASDGRILTEILDFTDHALRPSSAPPTRTRRRTTA